MRQKTILALVAAGCVVAVSPWLANVIMWVSAMGAVSFGGTVTLPDWMPYQVMTTLLGIGIIIVAIIMAWREGSPPSNRSDRTTSSQSDDEARN